MSITVLLKKSQIVFPGNRKLLSQFTFSKGFPNLVSIIIPHNQVVLFCFVGWAVAIILIFYLFVFISCPIHAHLNTTVLCWLFTYTALPPTHTAQHITGYFCKQLLGVAPVPLRSLMSACWLSLSAYSWIGWAKSKESISSKSCPPNVSSISGISSEKGISSN